MRLMQAQELKCPGCFAPIVPSHGGLAKCRYCGATVAIQGAAPGAPNAMAPNAPVYLEHGGKNLIEVIKVVRQHTRLGLREAKDLVERAPCVVADWPDQPQRLEDFRRDLARAGARVR